MSEAGGRAWQRMLSGRRLDILNPSPIDIEINDVALSLARIARWNGQTIGDHGYSVAQHSILVAELLAVEDTAASSKCLLAALLHDGPEYVCSDLVTPFKRAVGDSYRALEARMAEAIHLAFGLPAVLPAKWVEVIDRADKLAAFIEAIKLAGFSEAEARAVFGFRRSAPDVDLEPWDAKTAQARFLSVFHDLAAGGNKCIQRWRMSSDSSRAIA